MGTKGSAGKIQSIRFPIWMSEKLKKIAGDEGVTVSDIVLKFCEYQLNEMGYYWEIGSRASASVQKITEKIG